MSPLGQGGMGTLYLARDPVLERTVAIKVLSIHNDELRERFSREARSAAALNHPNIVTVYDVGEDDGRPFIAMEYVDGETLAEMIGRRPALELDRKLQLFLEISGALAYAHKAGIIHRDIKPANIMIATDGSVKILDFGLARLMADASQAGLTRVGMVLGTPHYMAPEQIEGQPVDERVDIFAAGLVLYELLSYRKAYFGDTPHAVLHKIVTSSPPPLSDVCPGIDPELEHIVNKAIEKSPDQRYQKLTFLISDLSRLKARLSEHREEPTVLVGPAPPAKKLDSGSSGTPRNIPNLESISRRRAAQIEQYLTDARQHFQAGRFEAAVEQSELAFALDPQDQRVLELLADAHRGIEDGQVREWLDQAQAHIARGALSEADLLISQSLQLRPESAEASQLQRALGDRRRELERVRERARATRAALDRGRISLAEGAFEAAARSANEALAFDSSSTEAQELKRQALEFLDERRRQQQLELRASDAVNDARQRAQRGDFQSALRILRAFTPAHPLVIEAAAEIASEVSRQDRQRETEAERRRQQQAREQAEEAARLQQAFDANLSEAVKAFKADALSKALGFIEEALRIRPEDARANDLLTKTLGLIESRKQQEEQKRAAKSTAATARRMFTSGDYDEAIRLLERFEQQALVAPILAELRAELRALQQQAPAVEEPPTLRVPVPAAPAPVASPTTPGTDWRPRAAMLAGVGLTLAALIIGARLWMRQGTVDPGRGGAGGTGVERQVTVNAVPWATVRITAIDRTGSVVEKTTPFVMMLPKGEYRLEFQNPAFRKIEQTLSIGSDDAPPVSVVMPGADVDRILTEVLGSQ